MIVFMLLEFGTRTITVNHHIRGICFFYNSLFYINQLSCIPCIFVIYLIVVLHGNCFFWLTEMLPCYSFLSCFNLLSYLLLKCAFMLLSDIRWINHGSYFGVLMAYGGLLEVVNFYPLDNKSSISLLII